MRVRGHQQIEVSPERFWELAFTPDHLAHAIPGATAIEQVSTHRFTGAINRSLSGISVDMDVDVEVIEDARPDRIECRFHGADAGTNSSLTGTITILVTPASANTTDVEYLLDWELTGRLGSIGSRMVKRQLMHDLSTFLSSFTNPDVTPSTTTT